MPTRGVLKFPVKDCSEQSMDHWTQYDWKFTARRSGHYVVRLTYKLTTASLGVQFKMGETRLRKVLTGSVPPVRVTMGEIYVPEAGNQIFAFYAPPSANSAGFDIVEVEFVPTNEGDPKIVPAGDGSITLLAKDATTWSEDMRYEQKPGKNCLGFWTDPDDFAEWEFEAVKPGRYQVIVTQGCGDGNAGSEVLVKCGTDEQKFTVQDTGGFQNWKDVTVGVVEIKTPGTQRLVIDPLNKTKTAVLDVQKIVLKPVG